MKKVLLAFLIISAIIQVKAQDSRAFTLQEAIAYAMNNSLDVREAQIGVADADARVVEAKSIGIPQANFSTSFNHFLKLPVTILPDEFGINPATGMVDPNFNPEVTFGVKNQWESKLEVSSLLFDGSYLVGLEAAKRYTNQARLDAASRKREVMNGVRDAYLPALIITENRKIIQKNINNLEKLFFETKELYKAGFVEQLDVDRLELSLANLNTELETLDQQEELILNYLKYQMGYPVKQGIAVADNLDLLLAPATEEDIEGNIDFNNRAEYAVVQSAVELNMLNIKRFKAGYLPQLIAYGSYGVTWQGDNFKNGIWADNSVIGLQLNVPIFDGFDKKAKINRAELQLESVKIRKDKLERAIELQVQNGRADYKNAKKRVEDRQRNLKLAQKIYDTTQIKYKEGVGSSLEISQAEQALFQSQANYTNARYNLLVAKTNLDKALGN
ncbi:MAG: TolC family protein [Saprospiraceae bacterium]